MKKIIVLCSLVCCLMGVSTSSFAQQKDNVLKINPLSLAVGNISLSYERALSDNKSAMLHAAYWLGFEVGDTKFDGFTVSPEFRFYVTDHGAPQGFYLAPYGRYESISARTTDETVGDASATLSRVGAGVNVGYQFLFGDKVTLDMFLGPKYLSNSISYSAGTTEEDLELDRFVGNFGGRWGITVGFAF